MENDNGATILIGNVTQLVDAIASIGADEIDIHASKTGSETVDHDELRMMALHIRKELRNVAKAPAINEINHPIVEGVIVVTNDLQLLSSINHRLVALNDQHLTLLATTIAPILTSGHVQCPVVQDGALATARSCCKQHHTAFRKDASNGPLTRIFRLCNALGIEDFHFLATMHTSTCFNKQLLSFLCIQFDAMAFHPLASFKSNASVVTVKANHTLQSGDDLLK